MKSTTRRAWIVFAVFVITFLLVLAYKGTAGAHSWFSYACCSDRDCRSVSLGEVERHDNGWFVVPTGETIGFDDARIHQSLDPVMYRCQYPSGGTRCLYVPEAAI